MSAMRRIFAIAIFIAGILYKSLFATFGSIPSNNDDPPTFIQSIHLDTIHLKNLNNILKEQLHKEDYFYARKILVEIERRIEEEKPDTSLLAESYYYTGVYYQLIKDYDNSIKYLNRTIELKEQLKMFDELYLKAMYNLGGTYSRLGNFETHKSITIKALEIGKKSYGIDNQGFISLYASLITAYIELKEFSRALELTETACRIAELNAETAAPGDIAFLYNNIGVLYNSTGDYTKSRIFLEKAEDYYKRSGNLSIDGQINLLLAMSNSLRNLREFQKAEQYYERGIEMAKQNFSLASYQLLCIHAKNLGKDGRLFEGESVMSNLLSNVIKKEDRNSQSYYEVLTFYADYLRLYHTDLERTLKMYKESLEYFDMHGGSFLEYDAKLGYSLVFSEKKEYRKSLEILQTLLFPVDELKTENDEFKNPAVESINADKDILGILQTKYQILKKFYNEEQDQKLLEAISGTSELIIALLDRIRINISEEESRLLLGDRYRNSYIDVISDFYNLYKKTGNEIFFEKAFEYMEKSKIAGLLTATRELKATQFHIPENLANKERELQTEISLLNDRISGKSPVENITDELIRTWKDNLFKTTRRRDSLVTVFEKDYPDYYSIKYNTQVIKPLAVSEVAGQKTNYISYVVSDTGLYISIVNRKYQKLIFVPVDSVFFKKISQFRRLLSSPDFNNAREGFNNYLETGFLLYKTLIIPVKEYLVSDRILISPDNLLSYVPFETLPVKSDSKKSLSYKDIIYMMEEYDISYTYSATFLAENVNSSKIKGSEALVFAPDYSEPVDIHNLFQRRQQEGDVLLDLPYARAEAEYVFKTMGGKLLINGSAKESVFKSEAPDFDIIHLAMHTVLDDKDPMNSTLIFSPDSSEGNDRFLRTSEVYNIPLKARMVVLSSCNTGTGKLFSGEGILSLARGFIYSGSESVIMSMWEIEDRAGTDIVKLYYDYLRKGYSKSISLRKARIEFLKKADQLRSHPYFWSALVVYGDNSSLFIPFWLYFLIPILFVIAGALFYYLRKRRYS